MFLGMQAALFYHAKTVAIAAAQQGARAAGAEQGRESDGVGAANDFLDEAGGDDVLTGTSTSANRTATTATVTVSGFSLSVIPGWKVRITQSASVPVETGDGAVIRRDERGSAAIEAAIGVPAFALFVGLIIFGGRTATTHEALQSAAADAARSASLARDARRRPRRRTRGSDGEHHQPEDRLLGHRRRPSTRPTSTSSRASRAP